MSQDRKEESLSIFNQLPRVRVSGDWSAVLNGDEKQEFEHLLPDFLMHRRWFGGKGRTIASVTINESVPIPHDGTTSYLVLAEVKYSEGKNDLYLMGLSFAESEVAEAALHGDHNAALLRVGAKDSEGVIYDAVRDRGFVIALLDSIDRESKFASNEGEVASSRTEKFEELRKEFTDASPRVMSAEQSNTSIVFGERLIMKLFRRVESGMNPDFEVGRFLTEHGFFNTPPVAGAIEMSPTEQDEEPRTLGLLQGFVPNKGDAWKYTLESLASSLHKAVELRNKVLDLQLPDASPMELANEETPTLVVQLAGDYINSVRLLGKRTAEMHVTLDTDDKQPNFAPENFSSGYQRSEHHMMRRLASIVFSQLKEQLERLPARTRSTAQQLLSREQEVNEVLDAELEGVFDAERTRIHGDYHLGQVLYTGEDFVIIDFEGEPMRPLRERRVKRSPLRDVAGMLRSFDYAGSTGAMQANVPDEDREVVERFARIWVSWISAAFLSSYLETAKQASFMPADPQETATMLDIFLLDKAVYELGYEINNRPTWVGIPISGILNILDQRGEQRDAGQRRVA